MYLEHEPVATHMRLKHRGERKTVPDHTPPAAQAWLLKDSKWCMAEAEPVGPASAAMVRGMFGDKVLIRMRAVQGVLGLQKKYGAVRLEAACSRANHYGTPGLNVVKRTLRKNSTSKTCWPLSTRWPAPTLREAASTAPPTQVMIARPVRGDGGSR